MSSQKSRSSRLIARQLALGFSSVSVLAVATCVMLMVTLEHVSQIVASMHSQESSVRLGLDLATAVREQSLHLAHTIVEADDSHLEHYEQWRQRVRSFIQQMAAEVPAGEGWRLQVLGEKTQRLHDVFTSEVLPAVRSGDTEQVRRGHRIIDELGQEASEQADALAKSIESKMARSHSEATASTRVGLLVGGLCSFLILSLSAAFTFRIQRAVLKPLSALTESVRRYAQGDFDRRVGEVGEGEIRELAVAFDAMADELRAREKELVHQGRLAAIGQLAAGVAHELNNPIGIIRGYLKTMSPDEDAETLKAELAILDEEAAQCQRIAEDLLSYSRTSDLDIEPVDIKGLLLETVSRFSDNQKAAPQDVLVEAETQELPMDRSRIRQVLLNLLRNAAQASGGAGPIEVRGRVDGDHYLVDVLDHGSGVAESERQKVFEPFYTKRRGGSGLGLSVVAGIVRAHGGTVEVLPAPSGGALFRVSLPRVHTGPKSAPPVSERKS